MGEAPSTAHDDSLGPYQIERELARGGMGAVYLVRHRETQARYALKTIVPALLGSASVSELQRFRREAEVMGQLDHPHVARIHAAELEGPRPYLVQELLEGGTLDERVRAGSLSLKDIVRIVAQLADGLQDCHDHGITHRDLKPQNVLFDERGAPKLVDFGLAHTLAAKDRLTETGTILGTPGYMAPEQANGEATDPRTDVYGLAALLYFMLARRAPFAGASLFEIVVKILGTPPQPPSAWRADVPRWLDAVCLRGLAKSPDDRYPDMRSFADALRQPPTPTSSRSLTKAGLAVGLVVGLALVSSIVAWRALRTPPASPRTSLPGPRFRADELSVGSQAPARMTLRELRQIKVPEERLAAAKRWLRTTPQRAQGEVRRVISEVLQRPLRTIRVKNVGAAFFLAGGAIVAAGDTSTHPRYAHPRRFAVVDGEFAEVWTSDHDAHALGVSVDRRSFCFAYEMKIVIGRADGGLGLPIPLTFSARALAFRPDGNLLIGGEPYDRIDLVRAATQEVLRFWKGEGLTSVSALRVGGESILSLGKRGGDDGQVYLWRPSGKPKQIANGEAYSLAMAPNGSEFAVGYKTGHIRRYDLETGIYTTFGSKEGSFTTSHPGRIQALHYSATGEQLVSVGPSARDSQERDLRVWELSSNQLLRTCMAGPGEFRWLDLSPDGERLLVLRDADAEGGRVIEVWATEGLFAPK